MTPHEQEPPTSWAQGIADYFRNRSELFSIETQEALSEAKVRLAPVLGIAACLLTIYLLTLAAVVSLLGRLLSHLTGNAAIGWEVVALILAAIHLWFIFRLRKLLANQPRPNLYEFSRAELHRDKIWLQEHKLRKKE